MDEKKDLAVHVCEALEKVIPRISLGNPDTPDEAGIRLGDLKEVLVAMDAYEKSNKGEVHVR